MDQPDFLHGYTAPQALRDEHTNCTVRPAMSGEKPHDFYLRWKESNSFELCTKKLMLVIFHLMPNRITLVFRKINCGNFVIYFSLTKYNLIVCLLVQATCSVPWGVVPRSMIQVLYKSGVVARGVLRWALWKVGASGCSKRNFFFKACFVISYLTSKVSSQNPLKCVALLFSIFTVFVLSIFSPYS